MCSPAPDAAPQTPPGPYPRGFVYGRGEADPGAWSLAGLKLARALEALREVNGRVLELGCGGGQYLRALRRRRPELEIHGIDLSPEAVREAGGIAGVTCCAADAADLPFDAGSFAAVIGFDILEHVADPARVLSEASRVLAPGGILHLYVPCEGNPGTIYQRRGHQLKARWGGHCQQFTAAGLLELLARAQWTVVRVRYSDYWLTQRLDYAFFRRLEASPNPERWWRAQALAAGGGLSGLALRGARRVLSAATWLENILRRGPAGAMGLHVTAQNNAAPGAGFPNAPGRPK